MNTKTTTILRTLLGSKTLWIGAAFVAIRIAMEMMDQNRLVSGIALIVGVLLMVVGIGLGVWRTMNHLVEHHGWRWVGASERSMADDWTYSPMYADLPGNIWHRSGDD